MTDTHGEFTVYANGLIYSQNTMSQLAKTVDSLNLRFKRCEAKKFKSLEQGYGTFIYLTSDIQKAMGAMKRNVSLEDFLKTFKAEEVDKQVWVIKAHSAYRNEYKLQYSSDLGDHYHRVELTDEAVNNKTTGWVFEENYGSISIFYLEKLKSMEIPHEYAQLIRYVDCMVDTSSTIFSPEAYKDWDDQVRNKKNVDALLDLYHDFEPEPLCDRREGSRREQDSLYYIALDNWENRKMLAMDEKMKRRENLMMYHKAIDEALSNHTGGFINFLVDRYQLPAQEMLAFKRSFRVTGRCSQDCRPRRHAADICKLAAENHQWDIFLRAHLDMLDDNFERTTDGSYAFAERKTYLKELEALNIDAPMLLIGTLLSSGNVSPNHYNTSTQRTGRALAEAKDKSKVENLLLRMISDNSLDALNRLKMAYTIISYNENLVDDVAAHNNLPKIEDAVATLPVEFHDRFKSLLN